MSDYNYNYKALLMSPLSIESQLLTNGSIIIIAIRLPIIKILTFG